MRSFYYISLLIAIITHERRSHHSAIGKSFTHCHITQEIRRRYSGSTKYLFWKWEVIIPGLWNYWSANVKSLLWKWKRNYKSLPKEFLHRYYLGKVKSLPLLREWEACIRLLEFKGMRTNYFNNKKSTLKDCELIT